MDDPFVLAGQTFSSRLILGTGGAPSLNVVEQTVVLSTTPIIPTSSVLQALSKTPATMPPLDDAKHHFEQEYLVRLLKITHGNVSQAARLAGRNRTEFYRLLERHQLDPAQFRATDT